MGRPESPQLSDTQDVGPQWLVRFVRGLPVTSAHLLCPAAILSELLQRENRVLHFWTLKKRRLDQCQQYVVFERSAKQVRSEFSLALSQFKGLFRGQGDQHLGHPEEDPSSRQGGEDGRWG